MRGWLLVIGLMCWGFSGSLLGQPVYNMSNATVSDCEGILLDSNSGPIPGNYDHNENYTFTICVPGATSITLTFSSFCTEADYDSIRFFDGADTLSPQIGLALSGTGLPDPVVSNGPCLTINFITDANVTCTGWVAQWVAEIEEPVLPVLTLNNTNPTCSTTVLTLVFDQPVHCDSLSAGYFSVAGPVNNTVVTAVPVNCMNDSATSAQLTISPGLLESGYYVVTYSSVFIDLCGDPWFLNTSDTLTVRDCPLQLVLLADPPVICEGECTELYAEVSGGDFLNYAFDWGGLFPNSPGPHLVCPVVSTNYSVTVTDGGTSPPANASVSVTVLPAPVLTPPGIVCQSDPPFSLMGSPAGGTWSGPGVIDPNGLFHPDSAGGGLHMVTYTDPAGCPDSIQVTVVAIDAGPDQGACPGTPAFPMSGFFPFGGTWSGMNISPAGLFNPLSQGIYTVTYTANGCTDTKDIYVDNISIVPIDTVCESAGPFSLQGNPPGGLWFGAGISSPLAGIFSPASAGPGTHTLDYQLQGCNLTFDIFVKAINLPNNFTACPMESPFTITPAPVPAGGIWTGQGITDPVAGIFDPSTQGGDYNDTLIYSVDGCQDTLVIYVRQTNILVDTLWFCPSDTIIPLQYSTTQRYPAGGLWSGPGVIDVTDPGKFDPVNAGPGTHTVYYEMNSCIDSMVMVVYPHATLTDTAVCEFASPFPLQSDIPGGGWLGNGISNPLLGIFDPQIAGIGIHQIVFISPTLCLDTTSIEVFAWQPAIIAGLDPAYCYKDTLIAIAALPPGGSFTGPGMSGNLFNPKQAGPGQHLIMYEFGTGNCKQTATAVTIVSPPVEVITSFDTDSICYGEFLTVSATASGGASAAYSYVWNQGLGPGRSHPVSPAGTITYTVTASDGCSDPAQASSTIVVNPQFTLSYSISDTVCFEEPGYAVAHVNGPGNYAIAWDVQPPQNGDTLFAPAFYDYDLTVTDLLSGCQISGNVVIPSHPYVRADFTPNPNNDCGSAESPEISFIDLSTGGTQGIWYFGDGTSAPYIAGNAPVHTYQDTGKYTVTLIFDNNSGCADTATAEVCIIPEKAGIYIPNAFSPNYDGINDLFLVKGTGVDVFSITIFDRWGNVVYTSEDIQAGWDGQVNGFGAPEGVYVYLIQGKMRSNNPRVNFGLRELLEKGTVTLIR